MVIQRPGVLLMAMLLSLVVTCCNRQGSADNRQATVALQDGKTVTGTIKSSSSSEVTVVGNDNITRTIPMNQVKSLTYSNAAPAAGSATAAAPAVKTVEIPAGTSIAVRSSQAIDSGHAADGQAFAAEIAGDVHDTSGAIAIPRASDAELVIVSTSQGGRIRGASDLVLTLGSVTVNGQRYEVNSGRLTKAGKPGMGVNKRTGEFTGGGAALGAIIGAIAGGGKGAAIGAGAGGGGGALTQILTKGKSVRVPAESLLTFTLDKPLDITEN